MNRLLIFIFLIQSQTVMAQNITVVSNELILDKPPFSSCHSSTIVENNAKELMVAFFAGSGEGAKDVCIWLTKRSRTSWRQPVKIADGIINDTLRYPCWNPVLFKVHHNLYLFYKVGPNPREWWGMVKTSSDNGKSWSKAAKLPDGILGPIKNKPLQLNDGTILSPSSVETDSTWKVHMERSADTGRTWEIVPVDHFSRYKIIQPTILVHGDNKLQILCRSDQDSIVTSWSNDNGKTWSGFSKLNVPNPNSGIDAVTLQNGKHLLVYNPEVKGKNWFNNRGKLTIAQSSDGINWNVCLPLESTKDKEFSYPAIIQSDDGTVHITYTYDRKNVRYVSVKID